MDAVPFSAAAVADAKPPETDTLKDTSIDVPTSAFCAEGAVTVGAVGVDEVESSSSQETNSDATSNIDKVDFSRDLKFMCVCDSCLWIKRTSLNYHHNVTHRLNQCYQIDKKLIRTIL